MDDVYRWIQELIDYYNETGDVLACHYVPFLTSHSKIALEYEREFLQIAIDLATRLPSSVMDLTHVTAVGRHLVVMYTFDDEIQNKALPQLSVDQFLRPIKIPGNKLSMTTSGEAQ